MEKKHKEEAPKLTAAQLKIITKAATDSAIAAYHHEEEEARERDRDKRLYNTRLLLERYQDLIAYTQGAVYDTAQIDDDLELNSLMELMGDGKKDFSLNVHSIQQRVAEVSIMLHHTEKMLRYYKLGCEASGKLEEMRRWDTIRWLYLERNKKTTQELADEFNVDVRTVQRYSKAAIQELSALLFGCFC